MNKVMKDESPIDSALRTLKSIVAKKLQWGRHYNITTDNEYNADQLLEAVTVLVTDYTLSAGQESEDLLTRTKELRACKAREGKLKKQVERLKDQVTKLTKPKN